MDKQTQHTIKVGVFVTAGLMIMIAGIYFIGARQNLFGARTRVHAVFNNVSGLQQGNSVRFSGINVGTVQQVTLLNDTAVKVTLLIEEDAAQFIKKDAIASIGSEGIMGDKVVTISGGGASTAGIADNDQIATAEPVEIETLMATLTNTGQKAEQLVTNLAELSQIMRNGRGVAGRLLSDTSMGQRFTRVMTSLEQTGQSAAGLTRDFTHMSNRIRSGQGTLGRLVMDDQLATNFTQLMDTLQTSGNKAARVARELEDFSHKLNNRQGTVGRLLTDTLLADNVDETLLRVRYTAESLGRTTEKVNRSWFFNFLTGGRKKDRAAEAAHGNRGDTTHIYIHSDVKKIEEKR